MLFKFPTSSLSPVFVGLVVRGGFQKIAKADLVFSHKFKMPNYYYSERVVEKFGRLQFFRYNGLLIQGVVWGVVKEVGWVGNIFNCAPLWIIACLCTKFYQNTSKIATYRSNKTIQEMPSDGQIGR